MAMSVMSGRVSYTFGLVGPSLAVDTACSASLVALHVAASSLKLNECRSGCVAGVGILE